MLDVLFARLQQKYRTMDYPDGPAPPLPDRFRGRPLIVQDRCHPGCSRCLEACPTQALTKASPIAVDLGRCLFCGDCAAACPNEAIRFSEDYKLTTQTREDLVIGTEPLKLANGVKSEVHRLFGRSLKLRQVSAGGCNGCESDTNVLGTIGWDLGRFGIQFVASPRHADGLLITGPVPENMRLGLLKTYEAVPAPKLVIAVGSCAISGGPFQGRPEVHNGAGGLLPIDLFIPGCPPHPLTILDGLLRLIGRI